MIENDNLRYTTPVFNNQGEASEQIEASLRHHWTASAAGDQDIEHEIYSEDVNLRLPAIR